MSLTGPEGGPATRVGTSIGDIAAGLFTAVGVNTALYHRERTGEGLKIDVSMLDSQVALLENAIARFGATGEVPGPIGSRHPSITPFGAFATADDPIVIAAGNNDLFQRLCSALGAEKIGQTRAYATNPDRTQNHETLKQELEQALAQRSAAAWLEVLTEAGIPCGPINDIAAVLADPQVAARNMIIETQEADGTVLHMAGNPIKLSGFEDPTERKAAPELDANRSSLLAKAPPRD